MKLFDSMLLGFLISLFVFLASFSIYTFIAWELPPLDDLLLSLRASILAALVLGIWAYVWKS